MVSTHEILVKKSHKTSSGCFRKSGKLVSWAEMDNFYFDAFKGITLEIFHRFGVLPEL